MEIQQDDGVVVDVAGLRQGFAELLREGEVLQGTREAPKAVKLLPSLSPPLYRPPWEGGRPKTHLGLGGRRPRGGKGCLAPQGKGEVPPP